MTSIISILLAILALSFLIFIHELGHYFMARREGMRVETFSIGFGRPLFRWYWNDVAWQIGWLPFGGYVKIAGMDAEKNPDPYRVSDGFFGKSPWSRMRVALMGPFVNLLFALLAFALLWVSGGREKPFAEYTHKAGWIDPASELYSHGMRPGDEIWALNQKPYQGVQDLLYLALTSSGPVEVKGAKVNYATHEKSPFTFYITPYPHPARQDESFLTLGILAPVNYLIYDRLPHGLENPLPEYSPMKGTGLQYGDRIVWVDGHQIFSLQQLSSLLNDSRALLTIERNGKTQLARVLRVPAEELRLDSAFRDELSDWQFAAHLQGIKFSKLYTIPYNLTNEGVVENEIHFLDKDREKEAFPQMLLSPLELTLQPGDRIIAVDGVPVKRSSDILKQLQERNVNIIVQREGRPLKSSWRDADKVFDQNVNLKDIDKIAQSIGTQNLVTLSGSFVLLKPAEPKTHEEIYAFSEQYAALNREVEDQKKQIAAIDDPDRRAQLLTLLEQRGKRFELGVPVRDLRVEYNPIPTDQFMSIFKDIWRTLSALVTGTLNPKWMSGPVGIVHLFQEQSRVSLGDALYWLGVISLNLGVLNLLPIPMLDGGTVVLSFFEAVTGRKIKPRTLEKLIFPFALLLILFLIYLTYQDLSRIFGGFWR
jgi:regulator of sigma E protease